MYVLCNINISVLINVMMHIICIRGINMAYIVIIFLIYDWKCIEKK